MKSSLRSLVVHCGLPTLFIATVLVVAYIYLFMPFSHLKVRQVVCHEVLPTQGEILITQEYNGVRDPYYISLFYRNHPSEDWKYYYIEHEDFYWWKGSIEHNKETGIASIYRGSKLVGEFHPASGALYLVKKQRTIQSYQGMLKGCPLLPGTIILNVPGSQDRQPVRPSTYTQPTQGRTATRLRAECPQRRKGADA